MIMYDYVSEKPEEGTVCELSLFSFGWFLAQQSKSRAAMSMPCGILSNHRKYVVIFNPSLRWF